jgi:hypothetical protein
MAGKTLVDLLLERDKLLAQGPKKYPSWLLKLKLATLEAKIERMRHRGGYGVDKPKER